MIRLGVRHAMIGHQTNVSVSFDHTQMQATVFPFVSNSLPYIVIQKNK